MQPHRTFTGTVLSIKLWYECNRYEWIPHTSSECSFSASCFVGWHFHSCGRSLRSSLNLLLTGVKLCGEGWRVLVFEMRSSDVIEYLQHGQLMSPTRICIQRLTAVVTPAESAIQQHAGVLCQMAPVPMKAPKRYAIMVPHAQMYPVMPCNTSAATQGGHR